MVTRQVTYKSQQNCWNDCLCLSIKRIGGDHLWSAGRQHEDWLRIRAPSWTEPPHSAPWQWDDPPSQHMGWPCMASDMIPSNLVVCCVIFSVTLVWTTFVLCVRVSFPSINRFHPYRFTMNCDRDICDFLTPFLYPQSRHILTAPKHAARSSTSVFVPSTAARRRRRSSCR